MAEITIKEVMAFFDMDAKDMTKEWKTCPVPGTEKERKTLLNKDEKEAIKNGIADGSLTY